MAYSQLLRKLLPLRIWPHPPTNVHEVQVAMGMFNYYRKFIPNFAEIAKSIVGLTKKNTKFQWTEKCQVLILFGGYIYKPPMTPCIP